MIKVIDNLKINYEYNDIGSDICLVFLHGWGQNIEMMEPLAKHFKEHYNYLILDLPGFGKSMEPSSSFSTNDYVQFLNDFLNALKIKKVILIGHSFGGRIALLYASLYKCEKLVVLAGPYVPEVTKLSWQTKLYKKLKKIYGLKWLAKIMQKRLGSTDYNNASPIMREVLVKAINTNLEEDVKKISCPTLLVWGDNDTAVPIKRAYELKNLIKDSGLVIYNGASHYAYLERLNELVIVLNSFLGVSK